MSSPLVLTSTNQMRLTFKPTEHLSNTFHPLSQGGNGISRKCVLASISYRYQQKMCTCEHARKYTFSADTYMKCSQVHIFCWYRSPPVIMGEMYYWDVLLAWKLVSFDLWMSKPVGCSFLWHPQILPTEIAHYQRAKIGKVISIQTLQCGKGTSFKYLFSLK